MKIYEANMLSFACGSCEKCPYRARCSEYNEYTNSAMCDRKEVKTDDRT